MTVGVFSLVIFLFLFVFSLSNYCCNLSDDRSALILCLNQSANDIVSVDGGGFRTSKQYGPNLQIAIVTRATRSIFSYSSYSYLLQQDYAIHNDYALLPLLEDSTRKDYRYHRKLAPLLEAMDRDNPSYDYFVWIDADLILLDLTYRIEAIAAQHPRAHIHMSADISSLANTGFIIVRNTRWTRRFLKAWHSYHTVAATDQLGFELAYRSWDSAERSVNIAILAPEAMNSIAAPMGEQQLHHKVLHLAAESTALRTAVFRSAAEEVCAARAAGRPVRHQLGVTRSFLQKTARLIYGNAYRELQACLAQSMGSTEEAGVSLLKPDGEGSAQFTTVREIDSSKVDNTNNVTNSHSCRISVVDTLTEYRTAVSKFAFATAYMNDRMETAETRGVRTVAHQLAHSLALLRLCTLWAAAVPSFLPTHDGVSESLDLLEQFLRAAADLREAWRANATATVTRRVITALVELQAILLNHHARIAGVIQAYYAELQRKCRTLDIEQEELHSCREQLTLYVDLPELLKLSAELTYELLVTVEEGVVATEVEVEVEVGVKVPNNVVEEAVWAALDITLVLLRHFTHPAQREIIEAMQRDTDALKHKHTHVVKL